jgi:hypothetical protein
MTLVALAAGSGAPGWVIVPAAIVLGYTALLFKSGADVTARGFAAAWVSVCTLASFFAAGAVVWWIATVA